MTDRLRLLLGSSVILAGCYAGPAAEGIAGSSTGPGRGVTSKADTAGLPGSTSSAVSSEDEGSSGGALSGVSSTGEPADGTSSTSSSDSSGSTTGGEAPPVVLGPSAGCGVPLTDDWTTPYELTWGASTPSVLLQVDGVMRRFLLRLPAGYDENTPYPIVFSLHGSDSAVDSAWGYNPPNEWPAGEVITVMPEGLGGNWDFSVGGDDIAFFDAINEFLGERLCIEQARRYVTGVSGGAVMSHSLACARGDQIRAIGAAAGTLLADDALCTGSVSAFLIHGQADDVVSFASGVAARDSLLQRAGCSGQHVPHAEAGCQLYEDCDAGEVVWCEHPGGHVDHISLQLRDDVLGFFQSLH